ncbi:MAG: phosphatase PAP2 family protein, partial [Thiohalospira sp.]
AALIAASRVVLGLHYPSDVLAGAAIGAGIAAGLLAVLPV